MHIRHDNKKLPFPCANIIKLRHNLFFNIPGENQDIIRFIFLYLFFAYNRDVTAGQKFPLLGGCSTADIFYEIRCDAAVVYAEINPFKAFSKLF